MKINPENLATLIVTSIKRALDAALDGPHVKARFDALERNVAFQEVKIADIEPAMHLRFAGIYADDGTTYTPGDCTTRQGGLWVCKAQTSGSFDHGCWQLAVKRGSAQ